MAVKIVAKKSVPPVQDVKTVPLVPEQVQAEPSAMELLIDTLGAMSPAVAQAKATVKQYETGLSALRGMIAELGLKPEATALRLGVLYQAEIGACGKARQVTALEKVRDFLGEETFMRLASVSLTDLDKYLTPDQLSQCVTTRQTGTRALKLIRRPEAA